MESVNDIIAEMESLGDKWTADPGRTTMECMGLIIWQIARRLKAAWERERAEVREIASTTILKERVLVGNAAALHKALAPWISLGEWLIQNAGKDALGQGVAEMVPKLREHIDESRAALSAHARNCDMPHANDHELWLRWQNYCAEIWPRSISFSSWLLATAEEGGRDE